MSDAVYPYTLSSLEICHLWETLQELQRLSNVTLDCQVTKIEIHFFSLGKSIFLEKSIFSREINFFSLGKSKKFFPEIHFFLGKFIFSLSKNPFFSLSGNSFFLGKSFFAQEINFLVSMNQYKSV